MKAPISLSTERACRRCACTQTDCRGCIERTGEPCSWVDVDLCSACTGLVLPEVMTPAILDLLGSPNFTCGPYARVFRRAGYDIEARSENEQAFILFRWLPLAILHGMEWWAFAKADLEAQVRKIEAVAAPASTRPGDAAQDRPSASED